MSFSRYNMVKSEAFAREMLEVNELLMPHLGFSHANLIRTIVILLIGKSGMSRIVVMIVIDK